MSDKKLAERLAREEIGVVWDTLSCRIRKNIVCEWRFKISTIRRAGLTLVEAEDGR